MIVFHAGENAPAYAAILFSKDQELWRLGQLLRVVLQGVLAFTDWEIQD